MPKPHLITIGPSHYCEKARWALERAGIEYVEDAHAPILHYAATLGRGQRTTPLFITPHGTIRNSTAILRHADKFVDSSRRLFPTEPSDLGEVEALEELFDKTLGPATRRLAYFHVIDDRELFRRIVEARIPRAERVLLRLGQAGIVQILRRGLRLDAERVARSERRTFAVFDEVDRRLARSVRYLVGDRFTAADLTFAALAAPVLLPPEYGWPLPAFEEAPPALRALVERFRSRPAGTFALRLYKEDRPRSAIPTAVGA
jgi:glutathione S-transferase